MCSLGCWARLVSPSNSITPYTEQHHVRPQLETKELKDPVGTSLFRYVCAIHEPLQWCRVFQKRSIYTLGVLINTDIDIGVGLIEN